MKNVVADAVTWRNVQDIICDLLQSAGCFPCLGSGTAKEHDWYSGIMFFAHCTREDQEYSATLCWM